MEKQLKSYISQIKTVDSDERTLTALVSTDTRDRMGEVVDHNGADLKNFKKNPVVLFGHQSFNPPIGKALWIKKTAEGIMSKVQFAKTQLADDIFNLFKGGFMRAFSIGFIPKEWIDGDGEKKPRRTFTKWELVEFSAVPVPANPDALMLAMKNDEIKLHADTQKAFDMFKKAEPEPKKKEEPAKPKENKTSETIEMLEQENKDLIKQNVQFKEDVKELRWKLYKALNQTEKQPEITDESILKMINDAIVGAIRRATGKVS